MRIIGFSISNFIYIIYIIITRSGQLSSSRQKTEKMGMNLALSGENWYTISYM